MDASIFLQCVCLTIEKAQNGGVFLSGRFTLDSKESDEAAEGEGAEAEGAEAEAAKGGAEGGDRANVEAAVGEGVEAVEVEVTRLVHSSEWDRQLYMEMSVAELQVTEQPGECCA